MPIRASLTLALLLSSVPGAPTIPARAQDAPATARSAAPAPDDAPIRANPPPMPGWATEDGFPLADTATALKAGFVLADHEMDHWGEAERDVIAEHFVDPAGAAVGRKPPLDFSYDLMDLTGTGYRSLILWPRITQLQPKVPDRGAVLRIHVFDGHDWHLGLDDAAMMLGVRPHLDEAYRPTGAMDLALIEEDGFKLFVFDEATATWTFRERVHAAPSSVLLPPVPDAPR